jgi:ATP-dependent DNA helicase RecQ
VPVIALTATADQATQTEMLDKLGLIDPRVTLSSFERPNITINTSSGQNRIDQIRRFISKYKGESGIVYCLSRTSTEKMASKLEQFGYKAAYYHAGMDALSRSRIQERFQNDEIDIICATIAFGMGIDKSNVRFVIHYNLPKNVEGYYQEIGRAGRDGLEAEALLFYSWGDVLQLRKFIEDSNASEDFKQVQTAKLDRIWELATSNSCRTNFILNYFGEYRREPCGHCDNCLRPPESFDGTIIAQKALSAISRCQQDATLTQIMDVLKGAYRDDIKEKGFHEIKTFGAGRDLSYPEWREYLTQCINLGIAAINYTDNSKLRLTPLSTDVLTNKVKIPLYKIQKGEKTTVVPKLTKKDIVEDELFELIRKWRADQARSQGIPAYTILHDKTIRNLVENKPTIIHELDMIDGIGQAKKDKYGEDLVEIIRNYLLNQDHLKSIKGKTHLITLNMLVDEGKTVTQIAQERGLNEITIYSHISTLYEQGHDINIEQYFTKEDLVEVKEAWFKRNKTETLKDIFDAFGGLIPYHKIRLIITYLKKQNA